MNYFHPGFHFPENIKTHNAYMFYSDYSLDIETFEEALARNFGPYGTSFWKKGMFVNYEFDIESKNCTEAQICKYSRFMIVF